MNERGKGGDRLRRSRGEWNGMEKETSLEKPHVLRVYILAGSFVRELERGAIFGADEIENFTLVARLLKGVEISHATRLL